MKRAKKAEVTITYLVCCPYCNNISVVYFDYDTAHKYCYNCKNQIELIWPKEK